MDIHFFAWDPAFSASQYVEKGTVGYDGKGWYFFRGGQLYGPYSSEEEAKKKERANEDSKDQIGDG